MQKWQDRICQTILIARYNCSAGAMAPHNQIGFFNVIVIPMLNAFSSTFSSVKPLKDHAEANLNFWKTRNEINYKVWDQAHYKEEMLRTAKNCGMTLRDQITEIDDDMVPLE